MGLNLRHIQSDKKLEVLNPSLKQVRKNSKEQSFTRTKRPELFPVKDEHANPCSYLKKDHTNLTKKAAPMNKRFRDLQKWPEYKSPGPQLYMLTGDPGKKLKTHERPLTGKNSFHNPSLKSNFTKGSRKTIFTGSFA